MDRGYRCGALLLDMICFEYLILAFDKLVEWTGAGKKDKIKIREEVLAAVENHGINLLKIGDENADTVGNS